eukprot:10658048-Lingulodinium_polyedra.AAC.1
MGPGRPRPAPCRQGTRPQGWRTAGPPALLLGERARKQVECEREPLHEWHCALPCAHACQRTRGTRAERGPMELMRLVQAAQPRDPGSASALPQAVPGRDTHPGRLLEGRGAARARRQVHGAGAAANAQHGVRDDRELVGQGPVAAGPRARASASRRWPPPRGPRQDCHDGPEAALQGGFLQRREVLGVQRGALRLSREGPRLGAAAAVGRSARDRVADIDAEGRAHGDHED